MRLFKNPRWLSNFAYPYRRYEMVPDAVFNDINHHLDAVQSLTPLASIIITAYNEEVDILRTVGSLSRSRTSFPFEIIVVDNNSSDNTSKTLERLHVRRFFQPVQGWGPGRQMGLNHAKGKYTLLADSDCIYPPTWVANMVTALQQEDVVSVYGRYSFIAEKGYPRWQLSLLELGKDLIAEMRHLKRPFLNSYGMSMGFITALGQKEGFYSHNARGEDGRMCYDLMKYGKIKQVKKMGNRVWTGPRTLKKDGGLLHSFQIRIMKELKRFGSYFNSRMRYLTPK